MKCFYHTDVDGKCAGAIVKKFYDEHDNKGREKTKKYVGIDYKDNFPFESIIPNETIVIVDFSLQKEGDFEKLKTITEKIIWIDHHKTAIDKHKGFDCAGVRFDGKAGCELAWEYFFPRVEMPLAVKYAGRYDVWDFSEYGETLNEFQTGIRLQEHYPESSIWDDLLTFTFGNKTLKELLFKGKITLQFRTNRYASLIHAFSFMAYFEGYKAVCCNVGATSSQLFDSVTEDYDLMCPFIFDGKQWTVSIYSKKEIDCSVLAKEYGGGGHKKAAGFQCKELPFKILTTPRRGQEER